VVDPEDTSATRINAMSDSVDRRELLERALRPLGALGNDSRFPQDRPGIDALIERLAEGRPTERRRFAYEDGESLPRYDGEYTTWLSPAGDGALRVRREHPWDLSSDETWREEYQMRFRTEHLLGAVAAPGGQDPGGPVVTHLTLYDTGVMVDYLMPRPPKEVLDPEDPDDPFAEPHMEAMFPRMSIDDGLGTEFKNVDIDTVDMNSSPLRARVSYTPAAPAAARSLRVVFESTTVEIRLEGS
jgi:hypothetical protein